MKITVIIQIKRIVGLIQALLLTVLMLHAQPVWSKGEREMTDVLLKSALASLLVVPFKFSASKFAFGGFTNFSSRSTGSYADDIDKGQWGYGGFVSYELTNLEVEAFAKNLHFNNEISLNDEYVTGESKSLVYGFGLRVPIWRVISLKVGYCLHEVKTKVPTYDSSNNLVGQKETDDNGFYYGSGFRLPMNENLSFYADATGYYLRQMRLHLVDAELGLRYAF